MELLKFKPIRGRSSRLQLPIMYVLQFKFLRTLLTLNGLLSDGKGCSTPPRIIMDLLFEYELFTMVAGSHQTVKGSTVRLYGGVEVEPKFRYPFMVYLWHDNAINGKNGS